MRILIALISSIANCWLCSIYPPIKHFNNLCNIRILNKYCNYIHKRILFICLSSSHMHHKAVSSFFIYDCSNLACARYLGVTNPDVFQQATQATQCNIMSIRVSETTRIFSFKLMDTVSSVSLVEKQSLAFSTFTQTVQSNDRLVLIQKQLEKIIRGILFEDDATISKNHFV